MHHRINRNPKESALITGKWSYPAIHLSRCFVHKFVGNTIFFVASVYCCPKYISSNGILLVLVKKSLFVYHFSHFGLVHVNHEYGSVWIVTKGWVLLL